MTTLKPFDFGITGSGISFLKQGDFRKHFTYNSIQLRDLDLSIITMGFRDLNTHTHTHTLTELSAIDDGNSNFFKYLI